MKLIQNKLIKYSENIQINVNKLHLENKISINKKLYYPFIFNNYIYYRDDSCILPQPENQITKRLYINSINEIIEDANYKLSIGIANHNFRLFDLQNKIYGIGGQSFLISNYYEFLKTTNEKYINYHNNNENKFLNNYEYGIHNNFGSQFYNPYIYCPYYANGLHLFLFNDINKNIYAEENNGLPILSGIKEGRHDGHYGFCNNTNIKQSQNGLSVYDSSTSILYNSNNKTYYLYQRANIGIGTRNIQYASSSDLINWSKFNLLELNPNKNYFNHNIYYNNFFKINGINQFIGILPYNEKINNSYCGLNEIEIFKLYYSDDCINWDFVGDINEHEYYNLWMVLGEPLLFNNKYYFFCSNYKDMSLEVYYIEKNRFSYATSIDKNKISKIYFNLMFFENKQIRFNFKTFENGYIKVQLKNSKNEILVGYSYNDFNTITENMNEFEYIISWLDNEFISENEIYIEIEGINFDIYSII